MGTEIALAAGIGSLIASSTGSYLAQKEQKKASRAAAAAAQKAANTAATVSTSKTAANTTETQAKSERAVQTAAARRLSVSDTVNRFAQSGLRKTLN